MKPPVPSQEHLEDCLPQESLSLSLLAYGDWGGGVMGVQLGAGV